MNTKSSGEVNFIIYKKKGDSAYTAVCLDFDIVETGDNPDKLRQSIEEAARMHIATVLEMKLSEDLLNRHAPAEYWDYARKVVADYEQSLERDERRQKHKAPSLSDIWMRNTQELLPA